MCVCMYVRMYVSVCVCVCVYVCVRVSRMIRQCMDHVKAHTIILCSFILCYVFMLQHDGWNINIVNRHICNFTFSYS